MPQLAANPTTRIPFGHWPQFLAVWLLITLVWLLVLPQLAREPSRAAHIQALHAAGIDPSAMYYSELEMMPNTIQRLEQLHARDSGLLWGKADKSSMR